MPRFKYTCPHCGAKMLILETDDKWPGCKDKEEVLCYNCHKVAYSCMTSGFVKSSPLTDKEYKEIDDL